MLQFLVFASNSSRHKTTGTSRLKMLFCKEPTLPIDIALPTAQEPFMVDTEKRSATFTLLQLRALKHSHNCVFAHDNHSDVQHEIGDFVRVFIPAGRTARASKLLCRYYSSYRVARKVSPAHYDVASQRRRQKASFVTHVRRMRRCHDCNDLYSDTNDEDDVGWIPTACRKRAVQAIKGSCYKGSYLGPA